jgi:multicomponent Na+:H+ antiporter subunit D
MQETNNILVLGPIFIMLAGAVLALLLSGRNRLQRYIGLVTGLLAWGSSVAILSQNWDEGVQVYRLGGWPTPYGIVLVADMLSALFTVMAMSVFVAGFIYVLGSRDKSTNNPVFMPLYLTMGAGLSGTFLTGDIFTLFVFLELMVMSSVILVAISDYELGLEAALKYIFISAMGTLFLLLGIAAVYITFGTLNIADVAYQLQGGERPLLAQPAAVLLMSAFLLKGGVFPFHFWQPDFHTAAPTSISAMLSSVVVKFGVYGVLRLTTLLFIEEAEVIQNVLIALGLIGIVFGSLAALRTHNAKRILAFSTLGQVGFILVAIGWGNPLALVAAIIYSVNHAFIKSAMLLLTGFISSNLKSKSASLADLGGAGKGMAFSSVLYLLGGLALAGVPPLNGFVSKVVLVRGGIESDQWVTLGLVVGAGIITMMYMVRTWQLIFQQPPTGKLERKRGDSPLAPALLIGMCIVLGVYAVPLVDLAEETVEQIGRPEIYIEAVLPPDYIEHLNGEELAPTSQEDTPSFLGG